MIANIANLENGAKIYYELLRAEPAIAYLHCLTTNATGLGHQRRHMEGLGAGSLAPDQRGHGYSTRFPSADQYTLESFTGDLELLLKSEGINEVSLVGHSMGAAIALEYAAMHPDSIKSLVLISGAANFARHTNGAFLKLMPLWDAFGWVHNTLEGVRHHQRDGYRPDWASEEFKGLGDLRVGNKVNARYSPKDRRYANEIFRQVLQAVMQWDISSQASAVTAPTLLIHGSNDMHVLSKASFELNEMLRNSRPPVILQGYGHSVATQAPEQVNAHLANFFRDIYGSRLSGQGITNSK